LKDPHADLGVLQDGVGVLPHSGGFAGGVLIGLDPTDVLTPPESPLLQAMPPRIQALRTAAPAHTQAAIDQVDGRTGVGGVEGEGGGVVPSLFPELQQLQGEPVGYARAKKKEDVD